MMNISVHGSDYTEMDRGKFESWLIRKGDWVAIAFTDYDEIKVTDEYRPWEKEIVEEFADQYDLPIA